MKKVLFISVICCIIFLGVPFIIHAQMGPCTQDSQCSSNHCVGGACLSAIGGSCSGDSSCASGHCIGNCLCMFDSECADENAGTPICCGSTCHSANPVNVGGWCCKDIMCQSQSCDTDAYMCVCRDDNDCPGQKCDTAIGLCESVGTGKLGGEDCENGNDCMSGICDPIMNFCLCTEDYHCPSGRECDSGNNCVTSLSCNDNAGCFPYVCNLSLNICVPCGGGYDCDYGQTCNNGYCESGGIGGTTYYCYFVDDTGSYNVDSFSGQSACTSTCKQNYDAIVGASGVAWCCLTKDLGDTNTNVCSSNTTPGDPGTPISGGSATIPNPLKCSDIQCVVKAIADLITGMVVVIGSIMIIISGIQFITSAGSEDKARRAKQTIIYTIIGIAIAISVDFIIGLLGEILGKK